MNFKEELKLKFNNYNIDISDIQLNQFEEYYNLLIEWNEKFNLTSITSQSEVIEKHFLDSVLPMQVFDLNSTIIDIGSGAGFPGIPLKIMRPDLDITLVDSLNKRITFLETVIDKLSLDSIRAIHGRCEDMAKMPLYREIFDYATARAVAKLNVLAEYCIPFIKVNGKFVAYKSKDIELELIESNNAFKSLYFKHIDTINYSLESGERNIAIFNKFNNTPKIYPRGQNKPRKNPL